MRRSRGAIRSRSCPADRGPGDRASAARCLLPPVQRSDTGRASRELPRYVLTFDNRSFRDVASFAPYDHVEILTNSKTYGGGGIFNLYSTVAADSLWSPYVFVHEFGHHFAGLADEYYTSDVAYVPAADRVEPWEPNVTALKDPAELKWKDLVTPGTPLPTPWSKEAFEKVSREFQKRRRQIRAENRPEEEMDRLFLEEQAIETKLLSSDPNAGKVGAFEGAMYEAAGYYRPQIDCIMFSRNDVPFCAVVPARDRADHRPVRGESEMSFLREDCSWPGSPAGISGAWDAVGAK